MLKIYSPLCSNTDAPVPCDWIPLLIPFYGKTFEDAESVAAGIFDAYAKSGASAIELASSPEDCDVFALSVHWPLDHCNEGLENEFAHSQIQSARDHGKPILIFYRSDLDRTISWPEHAIAFRFAFYSDTRDKREFAQPCWSRDLLASHCDGTLQVRSKCSVPKIGFCGYAPPLASPWNRQKVKDIAKYSLYRLGLLKKYRGRIAHALRATAISHLQHSKLVKTDFILRPGFAFNQWGVLQPGGTPQNAVKQRSEFVQNFLDNDYALCVRGLANCSIRCYEALSLGRIPVFINSQCVLPYDFKVDWKKYFVWVEEHDLKNIAQRVHEFHERLSESDFMELQHQCRRLYEEWISPEGFFRNIHLHLGETAS
jgi:hypothetical protein